MLILILTLFLIGGIFYFLFFSEVFKIKDFSISGGRSIDSGELKETIGSLLERRWFVFTANNFFILKKQELEKEILAQFKRIEAVKIQKKFPNLLKVEIKEKNLNLIWCQRKLKIQEVMESEEKRCFYLDKKGKVFGKAFEIDLKNLNREQLVNSPFILIEEEKDNFSNLDERITTPELIDFILQVKLILPKIAGLKMVKGNILLDSAGEIHIETEEGWQVYFDTTRDVESQVKILDLALTEKITKEEREALEYIDLRIPDRIYYK